MRKKRSQGMSLKAQSNKEAVRASISFPPDLYKTLEEISRQKKCHWLGLCATQRSAYLAVPVYEQVRRLAFEENTKMHTLLMEGLDWVFKNRGLPSIAELTSKKLR